MASHPIFSPPLQAVLAAVSHVCKAHMGTPVFYLLSDALAADFDDFLTKFNAAAEASRKQGTGGLKKGAFKLVDAALRKEVEAAKAQLGAAWERFDWGVKRLERTADLEVRGPCFRVGLGLGLGVAARLLVTAGNRVTHQLDHCGHVGVQNSRCLIWPFAFVSNGWRVHASLHCQSQGSSCYFCTLPCVSVNHPTLNQPFTAHPLQLLSSQLNHPPPIHPSIHPPPGYQCFNQNHLKHPHIYAPHLPPPAPSPLQPIVATDRLQYGGMQMERGLIKGLDILEALPNNLVDAAAKAVWR